MRLIKSLLSDLSAPYKNYYHCAYTCKILLLLSNIESSGELVLHNEHGFEIFEYGRTIFTRASFFCNCGKHPRYIGVLMYVECSSWTFRTPENVNLSCSFRKYYVLQFLPDHRKNNTLEAIDENFCFQTSKQQSCYPRLWNNDCYHPRIGKFLNWSLFVAFDNSYRVWACVTK